jgi:hypothetical protein
MLREDIGDVLGEGMRCRFWRGSEFVGFARQEDVGKMLGNYG